MPIPIQKALITGVRMVLRPVHNKLVTLIKEQGTDSRVYKLMERFGQKVNQFEVKLHRKLVGAKGLSIVPEILPKVAFNKGVEWVVELVFFYGVLFALAFYEMNKNELSKIK